jgi:hypothetical protein
MEGKMKKILPVIMILAALLSCDLDNIKESVSKSVKKSGYLTLLNLPENVNAVKVVKVGNVGARDDTEAVSIEGRGALIPLVDMRGGRFDKTGVYGVSLLIGTEDGELLIAEDTPLLVQFVDGEGSADLAAIEAEETAADYNLIILNLPERTDADAFKSLQIGDDAASCPDFSAITMEGTTAYAPLVNGKKERFNQTGSFYIGLNVEVDSFTIVNIDYREHYIAHFTEGIGIIDINNLGEQAVIGAALKVINLPENTEADSFKTLDVGGIAECADYDGILVKPAEREAHIPLTLNTGKEFTKSGAYYAAVRIIIDSLNEINITKDDYVMIEFKDGYGTLDIENAYQNLGLGYLDGRLTNDGNYYEPRVAGETVFELLGNYFRVLSDETIKDTSMLKAMSDGIVYVYAAPSQKFVVNAGLLHYEDSGYADFRYSKDTPAYNASRGGWYSGNNRALWKFLKLGNEYRYKVRVGEDFPFDHEVIGAAAGTLQKSFAGDVYPAEITLESGFYIFEVSGASGGEGGVFDGTKTHEESTLTSGGWGGSAVLVSGYAGGEKFGLGHALIPYSDFSLDDWTAVSGASGGKIIELINVKQTRKFWVYAGTAGKDGRLYGGGGYGDLDSLGIVGGGGGSGSYISDSVGANKGYILCAGGGGGGYVKFDLLFTWKISIHNTTNSTNHHFNNNTVRAYISGGDGGSGGGGGAGGWLGSYENGNSGKILYPSGNIGETGCGGGVFGGVPYHEPDGNGIIKAAETGKASFLKENTTKEFSVLTGDEDSPQTYSAGAHFDYFVKEAGGGGGMPSAENAGGSGGHITESGAVNSPASGGNNRNSVRGGNSGDGYVKIYKLL